MPDSTAARDRADPDQRAEPRAPPLAIVLIGLPDIPDPRDVIPDVVGILEDGIEWAISQFTAGLMEAADYIFSLGFETFLFYPNPATVDVLDQLWWLSIGAFAATAGLSFVYVLLLAQLFPGTDKADLQYHLERVTKFFVVVLISRELIAFFATLTNTLASAYYQTEFDLGLGVAIATEMIDAGNVYAGLVVGVLATLVLLVAGLGFLFVLVSRMFVIYLTYALLPLLLAFQLVEIGPWKIANDMGEKFLKATGKLMLYGVFVTALLWVGVEAGDFDGYDTDDASFDTAAADAPEPDARFVSGITEPFTDLVFFVVPLLIANYLGFQLLMEII